MAYGFVLLYLLASMNLPLGDHSDHNDQGYCNDCGHRSDYGHHNNHGDNATMQDVRGRPADNGKICIWEYPMKEYPIEEYPIEEYPIEEYPIEEYSIEEYIINKKEFCYYSAISIYFIRL